MKIHLISSTTFLKLLQIKLKCSICPKIVLYIFASLILGLIQPREQINLHDRSLVGSAILGCTQQRYDPTINILPLFCLRLYNCSLSYIYSCWYFPFDSSNVHAISTLVSLMTDYFHFIYSLKFLLKTMRLSLLLSFSFTLYYRHFTDYFTLFSYLITAFILLFLLLTSRFL